ncbi:hypothetical protein [Hippea maritima]|nr:hypothetical protein [Hippea maritima]
MQEVHKTILSVGVAYATKIDNTSGYMLGFGVEFLLWRSFDG